MGAMTLVSSNQHLQFDFDDIVICIAIAKVDLKL